MDKLVDYALGTDYFIGDDGGRPKLVSVDEMNEPVTEYCCEEMMAICSEIDGFFYTCETPAELDKQRRSKYYRDLCKQRDEHECMNPVTKDLLATAERKNPALAAKFRSALKNSGAW